MADAKAEPSSSRFNLSLRWRITLPFLLLAFGLGLGAAYLVLNVLQESAEDRFLRQLADSGQQTADAVVVLERELLEVERLIGNTEGFAEDVRAEDAESLRARVLPVALNTELDAVTIVNDQGLSLLSARSQLGEGPGSYETVRGEAFYADWGFVSQVLMMPQAGGEKRIGIGVVRQAGREVPVLFVAGPIPAAAGGVGGAILVGLYLDNVAEELATASGANVTIYATPSGQARASTLELEPGQPFTLPEAWIQETLSEGDDGTPVRKTEVAGVPYREALLPFVGRSGQDELGVLGVSLLDTVRAGESAVAAGPGDNLVRSVVGFGALGLLLIGAVGLAISNSIARPLEEIAQATSEIAQGNLDVEVPERGGGEVTVVARSFNEMVRGLRASAHGATATTAKLPPAGVTDPNEYETLPPPQVERLAMTLVAFEVRALAPQVDEDELDIVAAYDALLGAVQGTVERHRGQLISFDGVHGLAAFGLPGGPQPRSVRALLACHAACEMAETLASLDLQRQVEGKRGLEAAIAVHSGNVVVADIGRQYGLATSLLGDTVLAVQELLVPARQTEREGILLSGQVKDDLGSAQNQFHFGRKGVAALRTIGRDEIVHEVERRQRPLVADGEADEA